MRSTQRRLRQKNALPVVAMIGYTNTGKSTLLNRLTDAGIPANNRLFDTLDTTTRRLSLDAQHEVLLSDTVGFIRKLPTHLVEAFKATLEELRYADVLLHVIDLSNPEWEEQAQIVEDLVRELGAEKTPCLRVYNKCDRYFGILPREENSVCISAITGEGTDTLVAALLSMLSGITRETALVVPYSDAGMVDTIMRECNVLSSEYREDGIYMTAVLDERMYGRLRMYNPDYEEPKEDWDR